MLKDVASGLRSASVDCAVFAREGVAGPLRILSPEQCRALARYLIGTRRISPPVWSKGRAVNDGILARVGAHPALIALLKPLLDEDIVLWGASLVRKKAGQFHPWHSDIESSGSGGRFVSAWIGLHNTTSRSSMRFVTGSHLAGKTVQQWRAEVSVPRAKVGDEQVIGWARTENPAARIVEVPASDGDLILFDGRIWHGSINAMESGERLSLLLQYASADTPVRIPDMANLRWPFKILDSPRPPVIGICGAPRPQVNDVRPMPSGGPPKPLPVNTSKVHELRAAIDEDKNWQPFPIFRGRTAALDLLQCHSAMLRPGFTPHLPHAHQDEELLIVLDGEAQLIVSDGPRLEGAQSVPVKAGDFAYYPAFQHHTIRNLAEKPVHYLMFRWNRAEAEPLLSGTLKAAVIKEPLPAEARSSGGFSVRTLFEGRSHWLRKFHCHSTRLEPGAGYGVHADPYDVAILVQSGHVETLDGEARAGQLIFYAAGEPHGMRNIGHEPAHYLVFEWHGAPVQLSRPPHAHLTKPVPA